MAKKLLAGTLLLVALLLFGGIAVAQETRDNMSNGMLNNSDIRLTMMSQGDDFTDMNKVITAKGRNWKAGETTVSDLTVEEKRRLGGAKTTVRLPKDAQLALPQIGVTYEESFDWRSKDGKDWMTSVKSQSSCGSCWAFSAIGVTEAAYNIYSNDPNRDIDLSEQHLVSDCCNAGDCGGGWPDYALRYVRDTGVSDESCFPYTRSNSACTPCSGWNENPWKIEGYKYVSSSEDAFKSALQEYGPLSVLLKVPDDWFYYKSGIYEPTLLSADGVGWANHAVVLVGWDDSNSCWIVKNSWGSGWGEQGYARVKYGNLEKYNYAYAVTGIVHDDNNILPIAYASAIPENGEVPLDVEFTGTGTDDDGTVDSYAWTFDDGSTSVEQNPTHTYTEPGTYTPTLTVTDDDGATGSVSLTITVTESTAGGWISPIGATASSYYSSTYIPEKAIDDINSTRWFTERYGGPPCWIRFELEETTPISKVRALIYYRDVPMTLDVQVSNDDENWETIVPDFIITEGETFVEIPFGQTVNAKYVRLYETNLTRIYGQCSEFDVYVIGSANEPPTAYASAIPEAGTAPLDVMFTGSGYDPDGVVESFEWDFDDGESSTWQNPAHTYKYPGTYTPTLTVTDDDGATGSVNLTITVTESTAGGWISPVNAKASSEHSVGYRATNAIDDNTGTRWFTTYNGGPPAWIEFDLGDTKSINKVRAMIYYRDVPMTLDVQVSNDAENWNTVVSQFIITEGSTFAEIPFDQTVNARYVRLYETKFARMYGQCTEFDVYVGE